MESKSQDDLHEINLSLNSVIIKSLCFSHIVSSLSWHAADFYIFADNLPPSEINTNISGSSLPPSHCNNVGGTRERTAWIRFYVIYQTVFNNTSWTKTVHQHAGIMPNSKMNTCSYFPDKNPFWFLTTNTFLKTIVSFSLCMCDAWGEVRVFCNQNHF